MSRVIATAGHVDHGKSTLLLALTGIDPDRLEEEKRRGLTIDLGFAWTKRHGEDVAFIDVPGHARFLKNMLAGVGGIDAVLFVVAANEGFKAQSFEHLSILELLGTKRGIVVLTKTAQLDEPTRVLARNSAKEHLQHSFLCGAPLVEVDALTGSGIDVLWRCIDELLAKMPGPVDLGRPRLWIDRVFVKNGAGTVVTGTLVGGSIGLNEELDVVPARPGRSDRARVRGLETHGRQAARVLGPARTAVNLVGVDHRDLQRGQCLVRNAQWVQTSKFDASFQVVERLGHDVTGKGAFQLHIGSGQFRIAIRLLGNDTKLAPRSHGHLRVQLFEKLPLVRGDRFVIRELGRNETIGGGVVLDVLPYLSASRARPDDSIERLVRERGVIEAGLLEKMLGTKVVPNLAGRWVVDLDALEQQKASLSEAIQRAGPRGLLLAPLSRLDRAVLELIDDIAIDDGRAVAREYVDRWSVHPYVALFDEQLFVPPDPDRDRLDRAVLRRLVRSGELVECDGIIFSKRALESARQVVAELLVDHPEGITAAMVRDKLESTRKFILPLLQLLDRNGFTRRRGDLRIEGPRLLTKGQCHD